MYFKARIIEAIYFREHMRNLFSNKEPRCFSVFLPKHDIECKTVDIHHVAIMYSALKPYKWMASKLPSDDLASHNRL